MFVPYHKASTTISPSLTSSRLAVETLVPFFAARCTSPAIFSAFSRFSSTKVTECPPATARVPMPRPIFPAPIIVTFVFISPTLLVSELFLHDDHGDPFRTNFLVDDQDLIETRMRAIQLLHMDFFERHAIFFDAPHSLF